MTLRLAVVVRRPVAVAALALAFLTAASMALLPSQAHAAGSAAGYVAWGGNTSGELGDGALANQLVPEEVADAHGITSIAPGQNFACGIGAGGAAYCWGGNSRGELGSGDNTDYPTAHPVAAPAGVSFTALGAGTSHACGLTPAGAAYCWGSNANGQLGIGNFTQQNLPQPVTMPGGVRFVSISGGFGHTCALTDQGTAYCWGANASGQLGIGTTATQVTPHAVTMPGGAAFASLSTGSLFSCALTTLGAAYCWGDNTYGQLGIGNTTDATSPAATTMPTGTSFDRLAVGGTHVCATVRAVGLYCWGLNIFGQLGLGNTASPQTTAQLVPDSSGLSHEPLYAGLRHVCGLTRAGAAYCWGYGDRGALGTGTQANRSSPQPVSGSWRLSALATGSTSWSTYAFPLVEAVGDQVPRAAMQQFGRAQSQSCDHQPGDLVDFPALRDKVDQGWGASWAQWPNGGTGGFVCTRQPFYTSSGSWEVR